MLLTSWDQVPKKKKYLMFKWFRLWYSSKYLTIRCQSLNEKDLLCSVVRSLKEELKGYAPGFLVCADKSQLQYITAFGTVLQV